MESTNWRTSKKYNFKSEITRPQELRQLGSIIMRSHAEEAHGAAVWINKYPAISDQSGEGRAPRVISSFGQELLHHVDLTVAQEPHPHGGARRSAFSTCGKKRPILAPRRTPKSPPINLLLIRQKSIKSVKKRSARLTRLNTSYKNL